MSNERNCKERTEYEILLDKEKMETTKETSYEDGLVIAENYAKYEREIAELKNHIETIYELIAGDNATNWPQDEMIDYIKVLNIQIAEWQDKEDDDEDDEDEITEEEWCKQKGNYTTEEMNGEEITR